MAFIKLFEGKEWRCRYREWACGHSAGRESGMNGWKLMEASITLQFNCLVR